MAGSAKATIDHEVIRRWVEERGGCPSHVKRTGKRGDPGILRIDFPGFGGQKTLERISWDEFFDWFDRNELAFLYQQEKGGRVSRFCKLVGRDTVEVEEKPSERVAEPRPSERPAEGQPAIDAIQLIRQQHDQVRELFRRMEGEPDVVDELIDKVAVHLLIEEAVLYPVLLETELGERIYENIAEHMGAKRLIADLIEGTSEPDARIAQLRVLRRMVEEHLQEEEEEMLPPMEELFDHEQLVALAQRLTAFSVELTEQNEEGALEAVLSTAEVPAPL